MIVLDTNVVSELMRASPHARVAAWTASSPAGHLYTTAITQAEILHGIALLPAGRRRDMIEVAALNIFEQDFRGRVLSFGGEAAIAYARIASGRRQRGRPISQFDAQIAAITLVSGGTLATRNTRDYVDCGIDVVDPWGGT